jgi:hypothetical protein
MNIQPIVEGDGEVGAVPVLLRRLSDAAGAYMLGVNAPIRRSRADLVRENGMRKAVQIARLQPDCGAILIIFDGGDDCPNDLAVPVQMWLRLNPVRFRVSSSYRLRSSRHGSWQRSSRCAGFGEYCLMQHPTATRNLPAAQPSSCANG